MEPTVYYTTYDQLGNVTSTRHIADDFQPYVLKNKVDKRSQKSSKSQWDAAKGNYVYLTWHIHKKVSETLTKSSHYQRDIVKSYSVDDGSRVDRVRARTEGFVPFGIELATQASALEQRLKDVVPQYTDSELVTLAKASANSADFDLGTFIGEMPEVIRFAGGLVSQISRLLGELRLKKVGKPTTRRNKRGYLYRNTDDFVSDGIDASADAWLAYRYAVLPLVYSLEGAIRSMSPPEEVFTRTRVRSSEELDLTATANRSYMADEFHIVTQGAVEVTGRAQVYTMLTAADAKKRKVLLDLATTAWELVPLSFVVDWVLQVGSFLAAIQVLPCKSQGITVSTKRRIAISSTGTGVDSKKGNTLSGQTVVTWGSPQVLHRNISEYERSVVDFHLPTIPVGTRLSFNRAVDAFALSWNLSRTNLTSLKRGRG